MQNTKCRNVYRIESARWKNFNYGANANYFVTICTANQIPYFGEIIGKEETAIVRLSEIGKTAKEFWENIPVRHPFAKLDEFVVMPNHIHGILRIQKQDAEKIARKNSFGPQIGNLSAIIRGYKSAVKSYADKRGIDFRWQSRFHDRVIRDAEELNAVRKYIRENPGRWHRDRNNRKDRF